MSDTGSQSFQTSSSGACIFEIGELLLSNGSSIRAYLAVAVVVECPELRISKNSCLTVFHHDFEAGCSTFPVKGPCKDDTHKQRSVMSTCAIADAQHVRLRRLSVAQTEKPKRHVAATPHSNSIIYHAN